MIHLLKGICNLNDSILKATLNGERYSRVSSNKMEDLALVTSDRCQAIQESAKIRHEWTQRHHLLI